MRLETKNNLFPNELSERASYEYEYSWEGKKLITSYKQKGFDVVRELKGKEGPFLEVAGPSENGFPLYLFSGINKYEKVDLFSFVRNKNIYISNLYKGVPTFKREELIFKGKVDFRADARKLPMKEASLDAIFCAYIGLMAPMNIQRIVESGAEEDVPSIEKARKGVENTFTPKIFREAIKMREETIKEAMRVLKPGGLLIWRGGIKEDFSSATKAGFVIAQYERWKEEEEIVYNMIIFMKKGESSA